MIHLWIINILLVPLFFPADASCTAADKVSSVTEPLSRIRAETGFNTLTSCAQIGQCGRARGFRDSAHKTLESWFWLDTVQPVRMVTSLW